MAIEPRGACAYGMYDFPDDIESESMEVVDEGFNHAQDSVSGYCPPTPQSSPVSRTKSFHPVTGKQFVRLLSWEERKLTHPDFNSISRKLANQLDTNETKYVRSFSCPDSMLGKRAQSMETSTADDNDERSIPHPEFSCTLKRVRKRSNTASGENES
ncbi:hypothetical protein D5R81_15155 [Parashewanella spongiae]|uniref:Uncharacterized protein n=1 Tax=Parashewanella spongiae TaxID=342950 RepID=A0A3A6TCL5_9GAMM|nr:hypothetical protein [Parashewanella spongiae]MCL1078760.1 hypothetical protein [Parashewanella spongiae]RJY07777.1 hypothetical protein D5R81_15155 [Parashewanella spongiae]